MDPVPMIPAQAETMEEQVRRLLAQWREETAHFSSSTQITGHPAYRQLITLGSDALPFLFRDLECTQDGHLSKALAAITGARPVPHEDRGRIRKVAEVWWTMHNGAGHNQVGVGN